VTTRGGLLIAGVIVPVEGLEIDNPSTASWCRLHPRDYQTRRSSWIRQVILHTTKGMWPQPILPGRGPSGRPKRVADYWYDDPDGKRQSAAQIVVGSDGKVACLADLARIAAYHATASNDWSVGVEIYQELGGGIYEAALASAVRLVDALCEHLEIPRQIPTSYHGGPLERMAHGGKDCVGVLGHRDNTTRRGRGDPGDEIFARLEAAGYERLDFAAGKDLEVWRWRQRRLNAMAEQLTVDGLAGPSTMAALRRRGMRDGRELLDAAAVG
jgi:hypothetical protein